MIPSSSKEAKLGLDLIEKRYPGTIDLLLADEAYLDDILSSDGELYERLFQAYSHEMPYGTAKARDGDPVQWIVDELESELEHLRKTLGTK